MQDAIPRLDPSLTPPEVLGTAELAHRAFAGVALDDLLQATLRPAESGAEAAAQALDASVAYRLNFQSMRAQALQDAALALVPLYRVASNGPARLRLLALLAPGDLMVNTPLDFITRHLDVRLDLLFVRPGCPLPEVLPDHDVAFFAASESAPAVPERLAPLFHRWPRPALNDPALAARLTRDGVARGIARLPGCAAPDFTRLSRAEAADWQDFPVLLRPVGSHAGQDLAKLDDAAALAAYLEAVPGEAFFACPFIDYRSADGLFRKYRVAFVAGVPFLCHMAASGHWMVHYLNAGMTGSAAKRAMEAEAMEGFATGFARRHAAAFAAVNDWLGLEYSQIDCAELPDGRLLVFEADTAAIIHQMDPPDLFPYKREPMQRVMDAFGAMLRRHAGARAAIAEPAAV